MTIDTPSASPSPGTPAPRFSLTGWVVPILLLLGGITGVIARLDWIIANLLEVAGLGVLLLFVAGIAYVFWRVISGPGEQVLQRLLDSLNFRLDCLLSRHRKWYLEFLGDRHRTFDIKGFTTHGQYTLELDRVFVDLQIVPTAPGKAGTHPLPPPRSLGGAKSIWEFLVSREAGYGPLAILGPPGSGKTTLLKHVALVLALRGRAKGFRRPTHRLPVLLFIRDIAKRIAGDQPPTLAELARDSAKEKGRRCPPLGWFQKWLDRGGCLVMLDGYDEAADLAPRRKVGDWIDQQIAASRQNRFLVTSRPLGYRAHPLTEVTVLEVQPFTAKQVRRFVENWYLANEILAHGGREDEGVRMEARRGARDLLDRLGRGPGAAIADLAVNPLLLTMIATVHRYRSSLPGRRVELYAEICEVFLGKRRQAAGVEDPLTPAQRQTALQPLAYAMMESGKRDVDLATAEKAIKPVLPRIGWHDGAAKFLKDVEERSGLVLERESGRYGFAHLAFQEFLAASHIIEKGLTNGLPGRIAESWWHETIRLACAKGDGSAIVEACLRAGTAAALVLAQEIAEEAKELRPELAAEVRRLIDNGLESDDPERAAMAANVALQRRLKQLVRIDDDRAIDSTLITQAEYQLFIDQRASTGDFRQPDHWHDRRFAAGTGRRPVLGIRSGDAVAFCDWLTEREGGLWRYRLPTPEEANASALVCEYGQPVFYWTKSDSAETPNLSARLTPNDARVLGLGDGRISLGHMIEKTIASAGQSSPRSLQFKRSAVRRTLIECIRFGLTSGKFARPLFQDVDLDPNRALGIGLDPDRFLDATTGRARSLPVNIGLPFDIDLDLALAPASALRLEHNIRLNSVVAFGLACGTWSLSIIAYLAFVFVSSTDPFASIPVLLGFASLPFAFSLVVCQYLARSLDDTTFSPVDRAIDRTAYFIRDRIIGGWFRSSRVRLRDQNLLLFFFLLHQIMTDRSRDKLPNQVESGETLVCNKESLIDESIVCLIAIAAAVFNRLVIKADEHLDTPSPGSHSSLVFRIVPVMFEVLDRVNLNVKEARDIERALAALYVLRERRHGRFLPFEGLRIVRERAVIPPA